MNYIDTNFPDKPSSSFLDRIIDYFAQVNVSIRNKILFSFLVVIVMMALINAIFIFQALSFNERYDTIITNITAANQINGYIKPAIDGEMWNIVAGRTAFDEGQQYEIIQQVEGQIDGLIVNAQSPNADLKLDVILRTMDTLTVYIDKMGEQIAADSTVAENEAVLENVRGVSELIEDLVQDYMLYEVNQAELEYKEMRTQFIRNGVIYLLLLSVVIFFSLMSAWIISRSIYIPIKKLHDVTTTITEEDLEVLVTSDNRDEITELGMSFNVMIERIREMMDAKVQEQENLKKSELRTLQAQIRPHFLYNTLDTIVWMAESGKTDQVIEIVRALSSFFRIGLSKGLDWISIRNEIEHTRSYLTIQRLRYHDILEFEVDVDETILDGMILKLSLQPLVENALYHGIKNKRNGGTIRVIARKRDEDKIALVVEDDGIGFTPERLAIIRAGLDNDERELKLEDSGFGIYNVDKRIKLYYGAEYGVEIESQRLVGSRVTLVIPRK